MPIDWNYVVVREVYPSGEIAYAIRECCYSSDGEKVMGGEAELYGSGHAPRRSASAPDSYFAFVALSHEVPGALTVDNSCPYSKPPSPRSRPPPLFSAKIRRAFLPRSRADAPAPRRGQA